MVFVTSPSSDRGCCRHFETKRHKARLARKQSVVVQKKKPQYCVVWDVGLPKKANLATHLASARHLTKAALLGQALNCPGRFILHTIYLTAIWIPLAGATNHRKDYCIEPVLTSVLLRPWNKHLVGHWHGQ